MADSKNDKKQSSSGDFADDLDAMLNDAEASMDKSDDASDDKDVIDRLLVDDEFSEDEQAEKDQQQDDSVSTEAEMDEFADDDEFDVDDLLSSVAVAATVEDEPSEGDVVDSTIESALSEDKVEEIFVESKDEFDVDDLIDSEAVDKTSGSEAETESKNADADFLLADFDISVDDDDEDLLEIDEVEEVSSEPVEQVQQVEKVEPLVEQVANLESGEEKIEWVKLQNELEAQSAVTAQTTQDLTQANTAISELNTQVGKTFAENEELKDLITALTLNTAKKDDLASEEMEALEKEQRKLRKALKETENKVPVMTYIALGVATLALLIGSILGAIGYGAQTDVESLTELVATLEEEIEIVSAKNTGAGVREVNFKINALQVKDQGLDKQLAEMSEKIQQPDSLKTVVDDLVKQNDHAQKSIEGLLATVEELEQQKTKAVAKKPVKKAKKVKKAVVKAKWAVNLVSFKQAWYAKRKAEEFQKKGVVAKVEQVDIKGKKWFRLRVKGFKSKYEAAAYAVKVKKTLNLSSVWVAKD